MLSFSDLDAATQHQLNRGARLQELLKQGQYQPLEVEKQVVMISVGVRGFMDKIALEQVGDFQEQWLKHVESNKPEFLSEIKSKLAISSELDAALTEEAKKFTASFS